MGAQWKWERQNRRYANYGNANQWTVNAGLASLARESAQNSSDARLPGQAADLVFTFIRLSGDDRRDFEQVLGWDSPLRPHLDAMGEASEGAVTAGQLKAGLEAVRGSDSLVLLKISDYGCRGLTGPEFPDDDVPDDDYGNFIKLCRLDLFSGKVKAAGGSFGLGKAVYWRFSRLQTVLFNSTLTDSDSVDGRTHNRVFGVQQGVVHRVGDTGYEGRGHFGAPDEQGDIASVWGNDALARRLHLDRENGRPGTTALLVGFYDPDRPEQGLGEPSELIRLAQELRLGVEESFWPLLARERLRVRIEVLDSGGVISSDVVDPEDTYTELVRALRRFDAGDVDDTLEEPYSVVVRDVPIMISKRRTADYHGSFLHNAKLIVTLSDENNDPLENRVCLVRKPEMVVQTVDRSFEGRTYHAFLLAGAAISPGSPSVEEVRADDFLRFAEPPAHDRWIPGSGRSQTSQANLTAHYVAPWLRNLREIETNILEALFGLFGSPPPAADKPPEAILKHLRFLRAGPGVEGTGLPGPRKPEVEIVDGKVEDGRWHVTFQIRARNRREGWALEPRLTFVGLDGRHSRVDWQQSLEVMSGAELLDSTLVMPAAQRGRTLKAVVKGVSTSELPIPADEAAVEIVLRNLAPSKAVRHEEVDG